MQRHKGGYYVRVTVHDRPGVAAGVRIVPGGSSVREGAFLAKGVSCMPPMYTKPAPPPPPNTVRRLPQRLAATDYRPKIASMILPRL